MKIRITIFCEVPDEPWEETNSILCDVDDVMGYPISTLHWDYEHEPTKLEQIVIDGMNKPCKLFEAMSRKR